MKLFFLGGLKLIIKCLLFVSVYMVWVWTFYLFILSFPLFLFCAGAHFILGMLEFYWNLFFYIFNILIIIKYIYINNIIYIIIILFNELNI